MTDQYDDEEIILSELPDDELIEQMHDDLYDGLAEEIAEGTKILLERGWSASKVLKEALVGGMTIVGVDFRDGILFVPEVFNFSQPGSLEKWVAAWLETPGTGCRYQAK